MNPMYEARFDERQMSLFGPAHEHELLSARHDNDDSDDDDDPDEIYASGQ